VLLSKRVTNESATPATRATTRRALGVLVSLLALAVPRGALAVVTTDGLPPQLLPSPSAPPPVAPPPTVPGLSATPPADAATALARVRAAYEYGEMDMVVDSARMVAEGRLHPSPAERAQALRYLGIGLFLTGRQEGAETAFFDLLRLRPQSRLDPTSTRPDVVAFFEGVRRRHADAIDAAAKDKPGKSFALALLPPAGQFQSGHKGRGITIAALEVLSLGGALATYFQLRAWERSDHTFGPGPGEKGVDHTDDAHTLKALNAVSVAVFATTLIVGAIDGIVSYYAMDADDTGTSLADVFGRGYRF
jgi:hypothetical protein